MNTRAADLEELWKMRKGGGRSQRDAIDKQIARIMREDKWTEEMRQRLVRAVQHDDVAAIKYFSVLLKRRHGEMLDAQNT